MPTQQRISIADEIGTWPGVTVAGAGSSHVRFRVDRIEIGHLHGEGVAHLPLPRGIRDLLVAAGRVSPHPMFPASGWVERLIHDPDDAHDVLQVFRMNYYRAIKRKAAEVTHED